MRVAIPFLWLCEKAEYEKLQVITDTKRVIIHMQLALLHQWTQQQDDYIKNDRNEKHHA